jgi:polysaccharide biosynthesis transport protein
MELESNAKAHRPDPQNELSESSVMGDTDPTVDLKRIQKGLNLRPLFRIIRRNALLVASLIITVTLANAFMSLRTPRSYMGGFRLLVEPITGEAKLTDPSALSRGGEISSFAVDYPTLLQVLQSQELLSKVVKRLKPNYPEVTLESLNQDILSKTLTVQRLGTNLLDSTKLIDVTYKGGNPQQVQAVLSAVSQEYLAYSLGARKSRISGGVDFIEGQLPGLQQRVTDLQGQLQSLQQRYNLTDPGVRGADLSKQALTIENQKLDVQREIQEQVTLYDMLKEQLKLSPNEAIAASVLSQDPRYQDLLNQLKKVESEIAVKSARFSSTSPVLESLQTQQQNLSSLLAQETQKILGQSLPNTAINPQVLTFQNSTRLGLIQQLTVAANQIQVLKSRQQSVGQAEVLTTQQLEEVPSIIRQYSNLQRELDIAVKALNQLSIQRDTLEVEAAQKEVPWRLVAEPKVPLDKNGQPIAIDRDIKKKLPIGVVAGLLLGIGCAVILEKFRNLFFCTEDVQDAVKSPLMAVIPHSKSAGLTHTGLTHDNPKNPNNQWVSLRPDQTQPSLFQESFNALFASLRFLESSRSIRSLVVSSASPREGKTMIALHVAQAGAAMGQKVLLVDANFRTPHLHQCLELPNQTGLANVLAEHLDVLDCIQRSTLPNLSILTAGNLTPNSPRQLASSHMQQIVAQLETEFDLVIYDTPHLLGLSDTSFLTAYTDGLLLVVGVRKTKRSVLMQVLTGLQIFQLPVVGVVVNYPQIGGRVSYGYQDSIYQPTKQSKGSLFDQLTPGKLKLHSTHKPDDTLP